MGYTAVIGAVFIDIKGVPFGKYNGQGDKPWKNRVLSRRRQPEYCGESG